MIEQMAKMKSQWKVFDIKDKLMTTALQQLRLKTGQVLSDSNLTAVGSDFTYTMNLNLFSVYNNAVRSLVE